MLRGVARHADQGAGGEEGLGDGYGHVSLPDVHTIGADGKGNIDAVVNEDGDIVFAAYRLGLACDL